MNVDVVVGGGPSGAPLHFRVGDWSKPPVDISIGGDGAVLGAQVVLQDEVVARALAAPGGSDVGEGGVQLDVSQWPDDRYWDDRSDVVLARESDGVLLVSLGQGQADERWQVGEGLVVGFVDSQLCELRVGPLSEDEWVTIEASASP
ncbi:MAG: hypothetical protein GY701_21720 [Sulfitobacter sp.]|nr:hypothetical protein [Sulfitobacter sp.]